MRDMAAELPEPELINTLVANPQRIRQLLPICSNKRNPCAVDCARDACWWFKIIFGYRTDYKTSVVLLLQRRRDFLDDISSPFTDRQEID